MSRSRDIIVEEGQWFSLSAPAEVIEVFSPGEVVPALDRIEAEVEVKGYRAFGFIAYEASAAFDPALQTRPPEGFPLLRFVLYRRLEPVSPPSPGRPEEPPEWSPTVTEPEYRAAIRAVKKRIARGDTYQVNYTFRLRAPFRGDGEDLFRRMTGAQGGGWGARIEAGRYRILSASPELFFRLEGGEVVTRPMKGTAPRGKTPEEDARLKRLLARSRKNRAENLMIVDLLRNDLGRIAATGSVRAGPLFAVETYPTLFQMTSTVRARTGASLGEIVSALFPCGSVTGAPKASTMGIIAELETSPRRIYTGCLGLVSPGRRARFNVAIRTLLIDREAKTAEYGVGGGIVWDSRAGEEFEECRVKARIVASGDPGFALLESLLWTPEEGYWLIDRHLERLASSARHYGFPVDIGRVRRLLRDRGRRLPRKPHKVRLLAGRDGSLSFRAEPLPPETSRPLKVALARSPVDSGDPRLRHKTTRREIYDSARVDLPGFDEVILWNERGEVTEAGAANIVARIGGEALTPPLSSGLLPGTLRAELLERGEIRERTILREELERAEAIYLINSVRGRRAAELAGGAGGPGSRRRPRRPRRSG